jgi:hypothetical protein
LGKLFASRLKDNFMVLRRENPELVLDAMAYVEAVHWI